MQASLSQSQELLAKIRYNEVGKIIANMSDIPYAIIKGEPLSVLCYGKTGVRESSDVDFLILKRDILRFEQILISCGFSTKKTDNFVEARKHRITCLSGSHQIEPYEKKVLNVSVILDVNFDVYWGEYEGERIGVENFLKHTEPISVLGITVNSLEPIYAFLHLILHHYKEMNSIYHLLSHKSIDVKKFMEISVLFHKLAEMNKLDEVDEIVNEFKLQPYVFYLLYYADCIYPSILLKEWVEKYRSDGAEKMLDRYGLSHSEYKIWGIPFEERLDFQKVYDNVMNEMTNQDKEKYEREIAIFG